MAIISGLKKLILEKLKMWWRGKTIDHHNLLTSVHRVETEAIRHHCQYCIKTPTILLIGKSCLEETAEHLLCNYEGLAHFGQRLLIEAFYSIDCNIYHVKLMSRFLPTKSTLLRGQRMNIQNAYSANLSWAFYGNLRPLNIFSSVIRLDGWSNQNIHTQRDLCSHTK